MMEAAKRALPSVRKAGGWDSSAEQRISLAAWQTIALSTAEVFLTSTPPLVFAVSLQTAIARGISLANTTSSRTSPLAGASGDPTLGPVRSTARPSLHRSRLLTLRGR